MIRESLTLSDTAMVLLQEAIEAWQDYQAVHPTYEASRREHVNGPSHKRGLLQEVVDRGSLRSDIFMLLMQELWYLWRHADIPVIRHLDWHLTLDAQLMKDFDDEMTFLGAFITPHSLIRQPLTRSNRWNPATGIVLKMMEAYQKQLAELAVKDRP